MDLTWLQLVKADAAIEAQQLADEGRDWVPLQADFDAIQQADDSPAGLHGRIMALLARTGSLPFKDSGRMVEPDGLADIRAACPKTCAPSACDAGGVDIEDAVRGAWLGRVGGCLLGKPVEGLTARQIGAILAEQDNWPLRGYIRRPTDALVAAERIAASEHRTYIDVIDGVPEDDDINYTVIGLLVMEQFGLGFTPEDVAGTWLARLPLLSTCTAERVAYRNVALGILPPASARHGNPYREWIGAQIRADAYGYAALGDPRLAAELAWRDASVSHIANGLYGAMWAAAMIAFAPFADSPRAIIERGLGEIPEPARLAVDLRAVVAWHDAGAAYDEAVARLHARWQESNPHHWCHVISNAQVVAIGLLWGDDDPGLSICRAVQPAFDTDCNGATVGSIMGMRHGAAALPAWLTAPLSRPIESGVRGYHRFDVETVARRTLDVLRARLGG